MQATRILPDLQCSLPCEEVRQEANGNLFVIGVMGFIRLPELPITVTRICIFNRWMAGLGQFTETVRLLAPDQTTVLKQGELKFELRDPAFCATGVMAFDQIEFKVAGTHFVEVQVDGVLKLRYPLTLILTPPTRAPLSGTPPETGTPV